MSARVPRTTTLQPVLVASSMASTSKATDRVLEFLADPESGYITGEVYGINGGLYMCD